MTLEDNSNGVEALAPTGDKVLPYDQRHFLTYARLIDAEAENIDWREGAQLILGRDVDRDTEGGLRCWETHLARAHWIATSGYQMLLADSEIGKRDEPRSAAWRVTRQS